MEEKEILFSLWQK